MKGKKLVKKKANVSDPSRNGGIENCANASAEDNRKHFTHAQLREAIREATPPPNTLDLLRNSKCRLDEIRSYTTELKTRLEEQYDREKETLNEIVELTDSLNQELRTAKRA